jgi:hypothetical protein
MVEELLHFLDSADFVRVLYMILDSLLLKIRFHFFWRPVVHNLGVPEMEWPQNYAIRKYHPDSMFEY